MTHREMTNDGLSVVLVEIANALGEETANRLHEHIAALEARAERETKRADELADALKWERVAFEDRRARLERAEKALETAARAHAETRAMHSQMCQVAMQHQRDRDNARDAALEEAAQLLASDGLPVVREMQHQVRALKSQPARRFVEAETLKAAARESMATGPNHDMARNFGPNSIHGAAVRDVLSRVGLEVTP